MFEEFTYSTYGQLLELFCRSHQNLAFKDLPVGDPTSRYFVLRHDIDFSPEAALRMAGLESDLGIRATYFLLLSTSYYNLLSKEYCEFPRKLIELGHDVGFHYDVAVLSRSGNESLWTTLRSHVSILEQLTGTPVRAIAMHNPSVSGKDPFRGHPEYLNAYDEICVKEGAYFSDSCGVWRPETLGVFQRGILPPRFQVLVHPIFWGEQCVDQGTRLDHVAQAIVRGLSIRVAAAKDMWSKHPALRVLK
jgi:hypothetical protein